MNKICTTPEQSQKLIKLGINVNTADMQWVNTGYCMRALPTDDYEAQSSSSKIPAWSLTALLELVPKGEKDEFSLEFKTYKYKEEYYINEWLCSYTYNNEPSGIGYICRTNVLDAVFEMIVWLKENKKI